jgi:type VI secretion system protein ImpE
VTSREHFRAGQLEQAIAAALREVKADPGAIDRRCFLSDLLCFRGDLERADRQLDAAAQLGNAPVPSVALRRQLLRAEQARRQFFSQGALPEFLDQPSEELRLRLKASIALREGDVDSFGKLLVQAEDLRPAISGVCNDQPFHSFSDMDEFSASFFEVFTATGKYYWVPVDRVARLEFLPPEVAEDLLWRCGRISLQNASGLPPSGVLYFPTLYHNSHANPDDRIKLGRVTDWTGGGESPFRGLGHKIFAVDDQEIPILKFTRLEFRPSGLEKG